ncbi:hypothetical protein ONZ45_g6235 [Pleurotus djamor]|nr:hypothetical protein ONZ45_g6235 [Pleurotus djamor]
MTMRFLTAKLAQQIDEELMGSVGAFSIDQLMELAGLACAQTLATVYDRSKYPRVLVCCGPGNQGPSLYLRPGPTTYALGEGGDGLVAARHLGMFGYKPTIYMPKPGSKDIYKRLKTQCDNMEIETIPSSAGIESLKQALGSSDVILDAIFGFSFKGPVRAPFDEALPLLTNSKLPIVSVDIPSGWDVEAGKLELLGLEPDVLISLTMPKEGVKGFGGRHFLGGRFVPSTLAKKFNLDIPLYRGHDQIIELPQATSDSDTQRL